MKKELFSTLLETIWNYDQCSTDYEIASFALWHAMPSKCRDVLRQLVENGPVEDGDICSKSGRDDLIEWGLASRACIKGEQGYTVANYTGCDVKRSAE